MLHIGQQAASYIFDRANSLISNIEENGAHGKHLLGALHALADSIEAAISVNRVISIEHKEYCLEHAIGLIDTYSYDMIAA